jgi:hypothetical protein
MALGQPNPATRLASRSAFPIVSDGSIPPAKAFCAACRTGRLPSFETDSLFLVNLLRAKETDVTCGVTTRAVRSCTK